MRDEQALPATSILTQRMMYIRSSIFFLAQVVITPLYSLIALASFAFDPFTRYRIISFWSKIMVFLARTICGIHYRVLGIEHIPQSSCIVLSKHESAWETMAFQSIFPPQVWVLKRELLRLPFFGWGLALTSPIAIDRSSGRSALKQILEQGKDRLARGFWVIVFPEGTRVKPGAKGRYHLGGAWLATHTGTQVLPVAHNAGDYWGRKAFLKRPGTITVSIGEPIDPTGLRPDDLNTQVETWIEQEMLRIRGYSGGDHDATGAVRA